VVRGIDQHAGLGQPLDQAARGQVVDDRQRAQIVGADGEHPAVVVAALLLDGAGVLGHEGEVLGGVLVELLQVQRDLAGVVLADAAGVGQQFGDRHPVEIGQLGQAGDGHSAVAALVGADDDGLPAAGRLLLDALQGQPLLLADGAQAGAEGLGVLRGHGGSPSQWPEG
jgi:hypothetical protein